MNTKNRGSRDRFFATKRTALYLYSVLVVLPALVFGWLHWRSLYEDHLQQLRNAPEEVKAGASRVVSEWEGGVKNVLESEEGRDFREYQYDHWQDGSLDITFTHSPLREQPAREEVDTWFAYDLLDETPTVVMLDNRHSADWVQERERLQEFVETELIEEGAEKLRPELRSGEPWPPPEQSGAGPAERPSTQSLSLEVLAANVCPIRDLDMLRDRLAQLEEPNRKVEVLRTPFRLSFRRDDAGRLRPLATRQVLVRAQAGEFPPDLEDLARDKVLVQGFFLSPRWLLEKLPNSACRKVLPQDQIYFFWNHDPDALAPTDLVEEASLFNNLDIDFEYESDRRLGTMKFVVNVAKMQDRFSKQWRGFASVAAVMAVSLAIGMGLLVRSVKASLEQARRTENFVASVTHELRTPIAAVKMYGEMLRDGWVQSQEKQGEYYERIVNESDRLATLIDRVLLKRKLGVEPAAPEPGDLNTAVRSQIAELETSGTQRGDLEFQLAEDLPPVLLSPESVHSVLVNLVENARKYAPVRRPIAHNGTPPDEPILVRTFLSKGKVTLEVSDRGPGIPESERSKIFEAFYRIGDESTRTTPGTGLGLHLVDIQTRGMKARIQAQDRPGGGATFRVTFRTLAREGASS